MKKYKLKINKFCSVVTETDKTEIQLDIIDNCLKSIDNRLIEAEVLSDLLITLDANKIEVKSLCLVGGTVFLYLK